MPIEFSDFEDQTVGDVPNGWQITETSGGYTIEVSDQNPIEGQKSFLVWDQSFGQIEVNRSIETDETLQFAASINQDEDFRGDWVGAEYRMEDSGGNVLWSYTIGRFSESGDFEIRFSTSKQDPENDAGSEGTLVGTIEPGFHNLAFEDPLNNLSLRVDESIVHESGQSFSDASEFYIWQDDYKGIYDRGAIDSSQFVLLLQDSAGLRGGVVSEGKQCIMYSENKARVSKPSRSGDDAAIVDDGLGQS